MKTRNLVFGLAIAAALAVTIPALAATHQGAPSGAGSSASAHDSDARRAVHAQTRAVPKSIVGPSAPFTANLPDAAAEAELARSGSIVLPVSFSGPGAVSVRGETPVGTATSTTIVTAPDGDSESITGPRDFAPAIRPASATATAAGTVALKLTLTDRAKSELAAGHDLTLYLMLEPSQGASHSVPGLAMILRLPGS